MSSVIYKCENLQFSYKIGNQTINALKNLTFDVNKGDFVCFSGPSGSGKSTLLNVLGLIESVQSGKVFFDGTDISKISEKEKNHIRRYKLGFIFQSFNLIDVLRADENVEYFLARQKVKSDERKERVLNALKNVGLFDQRMKKPLEMSGGQRQRVAIARAIAKHPDVIIADEPTANLDQETGKGVIQLMRELADSGKTTVIMASHDPMVMSFASRKIRLVDGLFA